MKSITLFALALVAFANVTLASTSDIKANHYLTSFEDARNNSEVILSKQKKIKEEAGQLSSDVENLKHQKTIDEIISEDSKVIESNPFDAEFSEIENLKRQRTIEEIITEDMKVIEGNAAL